MDFYEENGYLTLTGVDGPITDGFRRVLADTIGVGDDQMRALLEPRSAEVHLLGRDPWGTLGERLARAHGPVLRAPLLEDCVYLGEGAVLDDPPPLSPLSWVRYLKSLYVDNCHYTPEMNAMVARCVADGAGAAGAIGRLSP